MDLSDLSHLQHLWLFAVLVAGIIILPGMDMAFIVGSAVAGGRAAGFAALAGVVAGGVVHVAMAVLGVGLLLQASPLAFNALLLAGAAYIGWIGWQLLRHPGALTELQAVPRQAPVRGFAQGLVTCLMNPKAYVFMIAVFPQFLRPQAGGLALQAGAMALIIAVAQIGIYGPMAWAAGGLRGWLRANPQSQIRLCRAVGALLLATAAWTAWQGWRAA